MGGPNTSWTNAAGIRSHWAIDLNKTEQYGADLQAIPAQFYDAIICSEVIEHLTVAPREIIKCFLSKLAPDGFFM